MTELQTRLPGSAETWRVNPPEPRVPVDLLPPASGSVRFRLRAWRQRHRHRERRAIEFFAASQNPQLGLPVADRHAVGRFFASLIRRRRLIVVALLGLHAVAAIAGLVVPRLLGELVDEASAASTPT